MALPHAQAGELMDLRPLGPALAAHKTHTLYKSNALELFRLVLPAGKAVPEHRVAGELTVQCLEGHIVFHLGGRATAMRAGELMCVASGAPHALEAVQDSSVLVTLLLPGRSP